LRFPLLLLAVCACAHAPPAGARLSWAPGQQLVRVVSPSWDSSTGELTRFVREGELWRQAAEPVQVMLGKNGSGWGTGLHAPLSDGPQKREGDGRAPAGLFEIGEGFGYADTAATGLEYVAMSKEHWCVDVPESPLYNRIVDAREVGEAAVKGSSEPMRRDLHLNDDAYRVGFVVRHNAAGVRDGGSCIFVHQQRIAGRPTAGCTALEPAALDALFSWLDAKQRPVFVLLPQAQYEALRAPWGLP
jgi:L,D-peptidoglycan transpeptidase YkuD (ErfK/YbiS/YcfS/YnhG family)